MPLSFFVDPTDHRSWGIQDISNPSQVARIMESDGPSILLGFWELSLLLQLRYNFREVKYLQIISSKVTILLP